MIDKKEELTCKPHKEVTNVDLQLLKTYFSKGAEGRNYSGGYQEVFTESDVAWHQPGRKECAILSAEEEQEVPNQELEK